MVADGVLGDAGTDGADHAGNLVPDDHRVLDRAPLGAHGVDVGVADAGELDVDEHLVLADLAPLDRRALQRSVWGERRDGIDLHGDSPRA
ncbi:hypothetical protein BJY21_001144 [Kineosphaera limosa]|nr:hypothetical protein [Kineosphaera limosa]